MQTNGIRMLAAIMFTDMVGYTALMQEDEEKAKLLRDRHRKVLEDLTTEHLGRIIQYFGDGTLTVFGSAIEAVLCAIEIQQELLRPPMVPLRIGLHLGDIVYDDEGIYGDSVNVASRIEALGVGGSVLISRKVFEELRNHAGITAVSIGFYELKNVKQPQEIFAISNPGLRIPESSVMLQKAGMRNESIAVLPFVNMSADPENEYFSDGITEEILNALARVDGLLVTSRTSSFAFKGKSTDIRDIGKQLGVKTVLEGSVRKFGNKIRVTAQLIDTKNGYHKWSEIYDRNLEDIFSVQDEIAKTIATKLKQNLSYTAQHTSVVNSYTNNMEAYNLFLKAAHLWNKWTPPDIKEAQKILEKVIKLDPKYAQAYSSLSACYVYLGAMGYIRSRVACNEGKKYALKAIELNENLPETHLSLAMVHFFDWNWDESYKSFRKALELNPNYALAHQYFSYYMIAIGNTKKAILLAEKAVELDPLTITTINCLADVYAFSGNLEYAKTQYERVLNIDPTFRAAINGLGWVYYHSDQIDLAIESFNRSMNLAGDEFKTNAALAFINARLGNIEEVEKCLVRLETKQKQNLEISLNMDFAIIYVGLRNFDKAFEYLERAFNEKLGGLIFVRGRFWKDIHEDSRFKQLLIKMNLPVD